MELDTTFMRWFFVTAGVVLIFGIAIVVNISDAEETSKAVFCKEYNMTYARDNNCAEINNSIVTTHHIVLVGDTWYFEKESEKVK